MMAASGSNGADMTFVAAIFWCDVRLVVDKIWQTPKRAWKETAPIISTTYRKVVDHR